MIKKIELWLNIAHYCFYKADYKLHMLSNKLNPFVLIGKIPAVKRKFEEQGTTHLEVANKVWTDRRFGFGVMISGSGLVITIFLILLAAFDISNALLKHPINFSWQPFVVCMGLAYIICHFTVFKEDKYIKYFKKFDKWTKREKWKYALLSLIFVIGSVALWLYSFQFLLKSF
ncbi:MAG: hypothetical protein KY428_08605 [Bacteroidetes bacterium]|nr:hypothetical protein [Bacteroidota bacterium]